MEIFPIKTRLMKPPKDNIFDLLENFCPKLFEKDIVLITSKILAIHQGLCVPINSIKNKDELIKQESDFIIPRKESPNQHIVLAIKNNTLIASAGIDESNANGYYILWPKKTGKEAKIICQYLKKKFSLKKLAVIITDSHSAPMRYGVTGISIGLFGLKPLKNYIGKKDLFGRAIQTSQTNIADSLATAGVLAMGEGNEQTPIAIIRDANFVEFTNKETYQQLLVPIKEDLYYPLLKNFKK